MEPLLHHSAVSVAPIHLVQKRVFVDIPLWQANLFLSVSSAAPGFPFRRLDWAVWGCISPMAQRMKPNRYGFSAVILNWRQLPGYGGNLRTAHQ